jgi:pimeloyl-ACP methyl ester carboxylesterase
VTTRFDTWEDRSPHASHFVTVNGVRLHYLDWGGAGEPLVLIHGLGDTPHYFDDLAPALRDRWRVIAYARRGHGRSEVRSPYDADTLAEDLRQLLDSLSSPAVHLAGWSLGGRELTRFAELHPARVRTLIFLDAAHDRADPAWRQVLESAPLDLFPDESALGSLESYRRWWQATFFAGAPWSDAAEAYMRDIVNVQPDGSLRPATPGSVFREIAATYVSPPVYRRDYSKVLAPALFVFPATWLPTGFADPELRRKAAEWHEQRYRPCRAAAIALLRQALRHVEIVELGGGNHVDFVLSQHAEVVAAMRAFLTSPPGSAILDRGARPPAPGPDPESRL